MSGDTEAGIRNALQAAFDAAQAQGLPVIAVPHIVAMGVRVMATSAKSRNPGITRAQANAIAFVDLATVLDRIDQLFERLENS